MLLKFVLMNHDLIELLLNFLKLNFFSEKNKIQKQFINHLQNLNHHQLKNYLIQFDQKFLYNLVDLTFLFLKMLKKLKF